ncbi:diacylglycerol kinase family protein [Sphingomonas elodea]|uniref:diacylglycerol kinase family protein n=1 Tax=Sphingomonas elodea TaxID=179878 RepID=UPI00192B7DC4|nr:diacylglycerol kinase family protein [Sphingomonas elodea]
MGSPANGGPTRLRVFTARARLSSFGYAARGVRELVGREHNAWIHLAATLAVAAAGLILRLDASDWRWLILAAALVWCAEAINTAVEGLCDHVHPGFDAVIGRVKDIAAGAVLIAAIAAALIGAITFLPHLLERCS